MNNQIAVIGGGGTGWSVAADLSLRGYEVTLCDIFSKEPYTHRDIPMELTGGITGHTSIHMVTTDIGAALQDADKIICCTISNLDESVAEMLCPYLKANSTVLLSAGNLGSLIYRRVFKKHGRSDVIVGESSGNLFSCRRTGENQVLFGGGYKPKNAAAFPAKDTQALIRTFDGVYQLNGVSSILETSLNGPNLLSHISLIVVNAGAIETTRETYYSFRQAICPATITIVDRLWEEKKLVMDALGLPCGPSPSGNFRKYADSSRHDFDDFKALSGPNSMQERHITEDVPIIGCLFLSLAKATGIAVPLYQALVTVAGAINGTDYYAVGRTLENLGLGDLQGEQISRYFEKAE